MHRNHFDKRSICFCNYRFRDSTYDIDALVRVSVAMKDAINEFGDEYGLPTVGLTQILL